MSSLQKQSFLNRNIRRIILILSLLAVAVPMVAVQPAPAASFQGQIREAIRDRIQERRGQRGQRGQREQKQPDETHQIAGVEVAVWRPAERGRAPLILFSHGFTGCNTQSTFLMEAMADAGYLVVAPNHNDNKCGSTPGGRPEERFRQSEDWSDRTYDDRRDDFKGVFEALRRDREWSSQIDWSRVGLVGHSLGGYTVLGLAGGWPSWRMSSIKAVLALSPYCDPYAVKGNLSGIRVPVMYQTGTRDIGVAPSVKKNGGCYAKTGSPSIMVEFEGAGHFAWTDVTSNHHEIIEQYSLAFLDRYVRGVSRSDPAARRSGISDMRVK